MKKEVLKYLGYKGQEMSLELDNLIDECIDEVKKIQSFSYKYIKCDSLYDFLNKEAYLKLLEGCNSYYLVATTLGYEIDKKIKYYEITNPTKALILDACASSYLIDLADKYEDEFGCNRTFRFCPGYSNTPLSDNKIILDLLKDVKPNITFLESEMLSPNKSMVGIIGIGNNAKKSCSDCLIENCSFRKDGTTCYKK